MLERHGKLVRSLSSTALGGVLLLSVMGCPREDENTLVVFGPDSVVVLAPLVTPAFLLPPSGTAAANRLELIDFDVTPSDAFGRATSAFGYGWRLTSSRPWYIWDLTARNSATDPRLPALGGLGTEDIERARAPFGACRMGDGGNFWGGTDGWDFFCFLEGLKPNTDYSALLYRYALQVNGSRDTEEMLLTGTVTQPDQLVPLGGAPGGYPLELCDFATGRPTYTVGVTGNQNPLNMGFVTSDAAGTTVFDCLVGSGGFWASEFLTDPSEAVAAANQFETFDLPKYNYLVIFEGTGTAANPIPAGPMVIRFQIGIDIDPNGNPIGNSYAPLPTDGLDPFQLAEADFAESRPDSVTMRLENLAVLGGSTVYQLFALNNDGTSSGPLDFNYYNAVDTPDGEDTLTTPTVVSSIVGGDNVHVVQFSHPDPATHLFIGIQDSPGGSPSAVQPLWMMGGVQPQGAVKTKSFDVSFGTFDLDGEDQRLWAISGVGRGGLFGEQFRVEYGRLPRPPVGYKYVGWLIGDDAPETGPCADMNPCRLPDETFTSPPPEYAVLEAADTDLGISDVVQPTTILEAFQRICHQVLVVVGEDPDTGDDIVESRGPDSCYDFRNFHTFRLTLEPRAADPSAPGPTVVLEGLVPSPKAIRR